MVKENTDFLTPLVAVFLSSCSIGLILLIYGFRLLKQKEKKEI